MKQVTLVGVGMGNPETLTVGGLKALEQAECVIGAKRLLEELSISGEKIPAVLSGEIAQIIQEKPYTKFCVALSGDIGFYSGAKKLYDLLVDCEVHTIAGISTVPYFAARLHRPWQDFHLVSCHGIESNVIGEIANHKETFFLTDAIYNPTTIACNLVEIGLGELQLSIGEHLSYPDETITVGTAKEMAEKEFSAPNVVLVDNHLWEEPVFTTHGISDDAFIRGKVPMTKSEVRSIILSKLKIAKDDILYDVGAGTGSVALEMALQASYGHVYAIEKKEEAVELIAQNKGKFGLTNVTVLHGEAPNALKDLPSPDAFFVGGSTGSLDGIFESILAKNPVARFVVTAITLETLSDSLACLQKYEVENIDIIQVAVTPYETRGRYHMAFAQNPIFVISGVGKHA